MWFNLRNKFLVARYRIEKFVIVITWLKQEKLSSRKCTIRVTHRSQNIENTWAFLSFKVNMTFTLNDIDLQMTLTFK